MSAVDFEAKGGVPSVSRPKVLISINTSWNVANFRAGLIRALVERDVEVVVAAPPDAFSPRLADLGCRHIPFGMDNKGTNPVRDALLFRRYLRLLRHERPDVFLGWTIKPNVYGSLAARMLPIPVINNVSGLGTVFLSRAWLNRVARALYRLAFKRSFRVFFQNSADRTLFIELGLVREDQARLVPGSGIDLHRFAPVPLDARADGDGPVFLLIGRLLRDKGIQEFVEAARLVRSRRPAARFRLLGFLDVENRTAISRATVEEWVRAGDVEYLGEADDVRPHIAAADCVVLPSYREGTPRSLLEASAMARPVIATDVPGCREVVEDGVTGLLCRVKDSGDLAFRMLEMAAMTAVERTAMGRAGRSRMERLFDEQFVVAAYLDAISEATAPRAESWPRGGHEWERG